MNLRNSKTTHPEMANAVAVQLRTLKTYIFARPVESFSYLLEEMDRYMSNYPGSITEDLFDRMAKNAEEGRPCLLNGSSRDSASLFDFLDVPAHMLTGMRAEVDRAKEACRSNSKGHFGLSHVLYQQEFPVYHRIFEGIIQTIELDWNEYVDPPPELVLVVEKSQPRSRPSLPLLLLATVAIVATFFYV